MTLTPSPEHAMALMPAEGYLHDLRTLAGELDVAIDAVSSQQLLLLEDSLRRQRATCARLKSARPRICTQSDLVGQSDLAAQIQEASRSLQMLNLRYSALIEHFGGTVRMFTRLAQSQTDTAASPASLPGKIQTWSCEL